MAEPESDAKREKSDESKSAASAAPAERKSRFGELFAKYNSVLSSLFLGVAGLAATSIWQYRSSETSARQAAAQQQAADTAAANSWKIERADILGKNVAVLASRDPATADQRYGVLLSLVRAEIIDPELAVSYALELGKDNPDAMVSVLSAVNGLDWVRLDRAYALSCDERFGTSPGIDACSDKLAGRSQALAELVQQQLPTALVLGGRAGPLALLANERLSQQDAEILVGMFAPGLTDLYDRRDFDDITRFQSLSPGAHLIGALTLSASRTGEFVPEDEAATLEKFHVQETQWLSDYLVGKSCDQICRGHVVELMLSRFDKGNGDYNAVMERLLVSPPSQSHVAESRLHQRLLWCQASDAQIAALRDDVLVPGTVAALAAKPRDAEVVDGLISLLALVPEPAQDDDAAALTAWSALVAEIAPDDKLSKTLEARRATAAKQRKSPPPALRQLNFCNLPGGAAAGG